MEQAQALLSRLQEQHPAGAILSAFDVENVYCALVRERRWFSHPWGSRQGVGKYLRELQGVRKCSPYHWTAELGYKERMRCYEIPSTQVAAEVIKLPTRRRA